MTLYQATLYHNANPILKCAGQTRLWTLLGLGEEVLQQHRWLAQEYGYFPWRELVECLAKLRRSQQREVQQGPVRIELAPTYLSLRRRKPGELSARSLLRRIERQFHELGLDYEMLR